MFAYVENQILDALHKYKVPKILANILGNIGLKVLKIALDLNWWAAAPHTPERYKEELRAIADGSHRSYYKDIRRLNMFPELTQAACTIVSAFAPATSEEKLLQLRALDWSSDAPINQYPNIVVYNPTEKGSVPFANIGFAGLVGSITAFGKNGVAVAEKVWLPKKDT